MKYVMIRTDAFRLPLIFPDQISHSEAGAAGHVVSAGFFYQDPTTKHVVTHSKAVSLPDKVNKPLPGDNEILAEFLNGCGALLHLLKAQENTPTDHALNDFVPPEIFLSRHGEMADAADLKSAEP